MNIDEMQKQVLDAITKGAMRPTNIIFGDNVEKKIIVESGGIGEQNIYYGSAKPKREKQPETTEKKRREVQQDVAQMTFRTNGIGVGHIEMLRQKLIQVGWIAKDTQPDAFGKLFTGKTNNSKVMWLGKVGKGTLVDLFRIMVEQQKIAVPESYGLTSILEAHFVDKDGRYLTDLNSSKPCAKHMPVIKECMDILQLDVDID